MICTFQIHLSILLALLYGGIGWFIDNKIKIYSIKFINHRISILKAEDWTIIGVYVSSNVSNNINSFNENLHDINQIRRVKEIDYKTKFVIIGDFNSDLNRKTKFDGILSKLLIEENLICVDHILFRNNPETYTFMGHHSGKSWIDHILTNEINLKYIQKLLIEDDYLNTRGHRAMPFELERKYNEGNYSQMKKK